MGIKYLWDTNVAISYLQKEFSPVIEKFLDQIASTSIPAISLITEIELLSWKTPSANDRAVMEKFIAKSQIHELTQDVKSKTIEVRRNHKIKLPDAIIAATALKHGLTLLTGNTYDFKAIANLQTINPWKV